MVEVYEHNKAQLPQHNLSANPPSPGRPLNIGVYACLVS